MAPTPVTNSTNPLQAGQGFAGDEFSNNLFSDLAPLLTLFGEQVTKQFLSMSMGWADDILLAMGPLGIITVIISAIRVGGVKLLKTFVGRARESRANAEMEILSSTSEDVCELWSGQEIVRELGNPAGMKDLILLGPEAVRSKSPPDARSTRPIDLASDTPEEPPRVLDINGAVNRNILKPSNTFPTEEERLKISNGAPNIALNVQNSTASPIQLVACATIGTLLQLGALVFPAMSTYYWKWTKGGSAIAAYGYPCFAAGTVMIVIGMIFCGRVIEGSTTEQEFAPEHPAPDIRIMRLQKACTVSDKHFPSYAIFNSELRIRTSRLNEKSYSKLAAVATLAAVVGFILQFVGLRALHWSATICQLGIMLILAIVRSWVRIGLAEDPIFYPLLDGHELAWLTLYILGSDKKGWEEIPKKDQVPAVPQATSDAGPIIEDRDIDTANTPPERQPDGQPRLQTVSSSSKIETPPSKAKKTSQHLFSIRLPFFKSKSTGQSSRDCQPFERMLEPLVRWEPFTGYYNVQDLHVDFEIVIDEMTNEAVKEQLEDANFYLSRAFVSLPVSPITERDVDSGLDPKPLTICRDLQRLVPTSSEVLNTTSALTLAIEGTMALLTKTTSVLWLEEVDPFVHKNEKSWEPGILSFGIKTLTGSYIPRSPAELKFVELELRQQGPDPGGNFERNEQRFSTWAADKEILMCILQIWLFSLELRSNAARKAAAAARGAYALNRSRYRSLRSFQPFGHRSVYYRILGPQGQVASDETTTAGRFESIGDWFTSRLRKLPPLGKDYASGMTMEMGTEPENNTWVVWGTSSLPSLRPEINRYPSRFGPDEDATHKQSIAVTTRPETTLATQCALELFSCFMDAIASRIDKVGGRTEKDTITPFCARNSFFESIANECVSAGLAHDIEEANTVIIPSFKKYNLLPGASHKEITFDRKTRKENIEGDGD